MELVPKAIVASGPAGYRYTFCYPVRAFLSGGIKPNTQNLLQKGRPSILRRIVYNSRKPIPALLVSYSTNLTGMPVWNKPGPEE